MFQQPAPPESGGSGLREQRPNSARHLRASGQMERPSDPAGNADLRYQNFVPCHHFVH